MNIYIYIYYVCLYLFSTYICEYMYTYTMSVCLYLLILLSTTMYTFMYVLWIINDYRWTHCLYLVTFNICNSHTFLFNLNLNAAVLLRNKYRWVNLILIIKTVQTPYSVLMIIFLYISIYFWNKLVAHHPNKITYSDQFDPLLYIFFLLLTIKNIKPQTSSFLSGRATNRGGGLNGCAPKEIRFVLI